MSYDAARVAAYYDHLGHAEWDRWEPLLELERMACVEPGYLDAGPHLIATARCPGAAALPGRP